MPARYDVDQRLCVGCGLCHERAPENLDVLPGDFAATVVKQPVDDVESEACMEAADYCPTGGLRKLPDDAESYLEDESAQAVEAPKSALSAQGLMTCADVPPLGGYPFSCGPTTPPCSQE